MQLFPIFQAKYALSVCPGSLLKKKSELPNSTKKKKDKSWFKGSPRTVYHVLTTGLLRARFSLYNEPFSAYFIQKSSLHPNFLLDFVAKIQLILHLCWQDKTGWHEVTTTLLCKVFACSPKSSRWHRIGSCNSTLLSDQGIAAADELLSFNALSLKNCQIVTSKPST